MRLFILRAIKKTEKVSKLLLLPFKTNKQILRIFLRQKNH